MTRTNDLREHSRTYRRAAATGLREALSKLGSGEECEADVLLMTGAILDQLAMVETLARLRSRTD